MTTNLADAKSPQQPVALSVEQALQQAVTHHKAGQLPDAERRYRAILQAQPHHPDANHNLGVLAVQVKQPAAALPHFKAALEANPNQGQYWLSYIDALIQMGQTDAARQVLEQGRQRGLQGEAVEALAGRLDQPEHATPDRPTEIECAIAHREAGRYKDAALVLQNWLASNPKDASTHALLAQVLSLDKQDEPAWVAMNIALSLNPALPIIQRNHARLLLKRQKQIEALQAAQAAYQSDAADPEGQLVLAAALGANGQNEQAFQLVANALKSRPNYAEAFATRALLKLRGNDLAGALADAEKSLFIKPHLVQSWGMVGSLRYQLKNLPGAIDALEKAVDYEPDNVQYLVNLGEFKRQTGAVEAAILLLERAVAIAPNHAGAWVNLGTALQELQRIPEAKAAYAKALAIAPEQAEVANNLGSLAEEEENWEEALRYFNEALEITPDYAEAHSNLGGVLQRQGQLAEAEASLRRALEIKPDFAEAHSNLGAVLKDLGRLDDAVASYRRALEIKPDFAEAYGNLGGTLRAQSKLDEALACYQQQVRLTPGNCAAQHHIASLTGINTERAPIQYVEGVFDGYAEKFDTHLQQVLKYEAPARLVALVTQHSTPTSEKWNVLDLGCGTGLVGIAIAPFTRQLVGVDLSAKMLRKAQARNLYQRLERLDLLTMMRGEKSSSYDVIIAADVFVYLGKLDEIISEIKRLLCPGGVFAFSIEALVALSNENACQGVQREYQLEKTGRYTHTANYITRLASANGFLPQEMVEAIIRMEQGKPVNSYLVLWKTELNESELPLEIRLPRLI